MNIFGLARYTLYVLFALCAAASMHDSTYYKIIEAVVISLAHCGWYISSFLACVSSLE